MIRQFIDRLHRCPVQPQAARHYLAVTLDPGSDGDLAVHAVDIRKNRKTGGLRPHSRDIGQGGAAQAPSGRQNETASVRLVLPEPLSPVSTTWRSSSASDAAA